MSDNTKDKKLKKLFVKEIDEKCQSSPKPLDFIYNRKTDSYDLDQFESDLDLIRRIQTGKGDKQFIHYGYKNLYVELIFADTVPKEVT